jgi:hypothetical protein
MRRPATWAIGAAVALGVAAVPGTAAGSSTKLFLEDQLAVTSDGLPMVACCSVLVPGSTDGTFADPRLVFSFSTQRLAAVAAGEELAIMGSPFGGDNDTRWAVTYRRANGTLARGRMLFGASAPVPDPILAGGPAGDAAAVWLNRGRALVSRRLPRHGFTPPVAAARFRPDDAGIDGQGRLTIVGPHTGSRQTLVVTAPRGGAFGKSHPLPPPLELPRLAVGSGGQAVAAGYHYANGATNVYYSYRPTPAGAFGPAVKLPGAAAGGVEGVAVDGAGHALIAWTDSDPVSSRRRLRAVFTDSSGKAGEPFWISPGDADVVSAARIAMNGNGDAAALWDRSVPPDFDHRRTLASFRPGGGDFGAPVDLTAPGADADYGARGIGLGDGPVATALSVESGARTVATQLSAAGAGERQVLFPTGQQPRPAPQLLPPREVRARVKTERATVDGAGRLAVNLSCVSWTFDRCRGTLRLVTGPHGHRRTAAECSLKLGPNRVTTVRLRLDHSAREALADGRLHSLIAAIELPGVLRMGDRRRVALTAP